MLTHLNYDLWRDRKVHDIGFLLKKRLGKKIQNNID